MANIKISELTAATSVATTDEFEINNSGTSKKATGTQIATMVSANLTINGVSPSKAVAGSTIFLAQNFGAF